MNLLALKKEVALFNLDIKLVNWKGPFQTTKGLMGIANLLGDAEDRNKGYAGCRHVLSSGRLMPGHEGEIHTFKAHVELSERPHINYGNYVSYVIYNKGKVYLDDIKKYSEDNDHLPQRPVYTLNGLYEKLPNASMEIRIMGLMDELKERRIDIGDMPDDRYTSEVFLKKLEQKWMEEISDQ